MRREILLSLRDDEPINPFPDDDSEQHRIIQLHHVHLPLLADYGLIEWNRDTGAVTRGENFGAITVGLSQRDGSLNHNRQSEAPLNKINASNRDQQ